MYVCARASEASEGNNNVESKSVVGIYAESDSIVYISGDVSVCQRDTTTSKYYPSNFYFLSSPPP